jgi:hypothetical protein
MQTTPDSRKEHFTRSPTILAGLLFLLQALQGFSNFIWTLAALLQMIKYIAVRVVVG